jgi:hypothetical protein
MPPEIFNEPIVSRVVGYEIAAAADRHDHFNGAIDSQAAYGLTDIGVFGNPPVHNGIRNIDQLGADGWILLEQVDHLGDLCIAGEKLSDSHGNFRRRRQLQITALHPAGGRI